MSKLPKRLTQQDLILYIHGAAAFQILHAGIGFKKFEFVKCKTWTPHGIVKAYK